MRVDLNPGTQPAPETNHSHPQSASKGLGGIQGFGEDQAQLSGSHAQVGALAAQAAQLPEVRQERVAALRQAVAGGSYRPQPEKTAGALVAHMIAGSTA